MKIAVDGSVDAVIVIQYKQSTGHRLLDWFMNMVDTVMTAFVL
jgi:hypothetical protein